MTLGISERSKSTRKLSVAFPNDHLDWVANLAQAEGCSAAQIVRQAIAEKINRHSNEASLADLSLNKSEGSKDV